LIKWRWSPTRSNFQLEKFEMPSGRLVVFEFPETAGAGAVSAGGAGLGSWARAANGQKYTAHASRKI